MDLRPAGGRHHQGDAAQIGGVLYFTTPNHVYAVDARTGRELWHYTFAGAAAASRSAIAAWRRSAARLLRHHRLQPGRARHQDRRGEVGEGVLLARDDGYGSIAPSTS